MNHISISSCPKCDPDTWIVERESKHTYICKCKKLVKLILKRKNYKEKS